jgi:2-dehydropantoate 2-reductase
VTAVADRKGVKLDADFANLQLKFMDTLPADMTASMYADLMKRQRLELPWLSSDVVRLGAECGVPTPLNAAISDILSIYALGGV